MNAYLPPFFCNHFAQIHTLTPLRCRLTSPRKDSKIRQRHPAAHWSPAYSVISSAERMRETRNPPYVVRKVPTGDLSHSFAMTGWGRPTNGFAVWRNLRLLFGVQAQLTLRWTTRPHLRQGSALHPQGTTPLDPRQNSHAHTSAVQTDKFAKRQ